MTLHEFSTTFALVCAFSIFIGGFVIPYLQDALKKD